ncbi:AAA family ATPase [Pyxidicoccus xibeiensis]|uniref:AAA family ATPase n=1 Tax=Pyxidicoccus xibeiensis TaxID=2906759 RepID=UPI0020A819A1|nr:ATP-binding protein [Pyxidicoccus xibeiensis]MCP3136519.1 AAA family ATPase [Pyxidicoccus xibeiensis]
MPFTLHVENYRALRNAKWSPQGLCVLVGPNGAGKSTLLDALQLLRHTFELGLARAINQRGGATNLRHFDAGKDEEVGFTIEVGGSRWAVNLDSGSFKNLDHHWEALQQAGRTSGLRARNRVRFGDADFPADERSLLRIAADSHQLSDDTARLRSLVQSYRCYSEYHLAHLRESGSTITSDKTLDLHGRNVFSLLRNWRDARADRARYDFVLDNLRKLFPDVFADFDFETAGTTVTARVVTPRPDTSYPITFAPNGLLIALLHLCAAASVPTDGIVAIDEVENSLHPFAIKHLVEAFRTWAATTNSTVLLATHSPVVLDQFRECPEQVFVMEKGQASNPVQLPKVRDPEYLSHFSLGDLYAHLEFGSPVEPQQS